MSNGTNNKCFICSKEGNFAKDCEENEYQSIFQIFLLVHVAHE